MNNALETRYFLSAMTGAGYYALHRQFLRPPERYFCILKGGPGCGKSTFLRRVGDAGRDAGLSVVWLHCAGDPASLDGVYFPQKHAGFFDGTAPHTVEPALFGASGEYLDLGAFCRTEALDPARIRALNADCAMFRLRAQQYLTAAAALDPRATPGLVFPEDREAARRRAKSVCTREFGTPSKDAKPGRCDRLFLSAVTSEGKIFFPDTVAAHCTRVYLLDDGCGLAEEFLHTVRAHAVRCGLDVISCPDASSPRAHRPCSSRRAASAFSPGRPRMCRTVCRSATSGSMFCPIRSGSARCAAPCAVTPASSSSPSSALSSSCTWRLCCTTSLRPSTAHAWTLTR